MTGAGAKIRAIEPRDTAGFIACVRELQGYERAFEARMIDPQAIDETYLDALLEDCRACDGMILVAEADGEIAGYACVLARVDVAERDEVEYAYALVADLVVREAWRGSGVGRALLEATERYAVGRGAQWLRIAVLDANARARKVYEDFGFAPRLLEMEKPLQPWRLTR